MAAIPTLGAPGTEHRVAGDQNVVLAHPAGIRAGDTLFAAISHIAGATQAAATYAAPAGWELWSDDTANNLRLHIFRKKAIGDETGTVTFVVTGGLNTTSARGQMWPVSGALYPATEIMSGLSSGASTTVNDRGVTTTGANRLAMQIGVSSVSTNALDFAGETGGDWTPVSQSASLAPRLWIYTAPMPNAGTIDGGSFTKGAAGAWELKGLAFAPLPDGAKRAYAFPMPSRMPVFMTAAYRRGRYLA